jgi:hypothetical protein
MTATPSKEIPMPDPDTVSRLRELEREATPGPWVNSLSGQPATSAVIGPDHRLADTQRPADATFIAEFRNNAKQLLAVVEAAEAMVGPAIAILRTGQTTSPKAFTARTVRLRDALEPLQDALRAFQGQGESQ